MFRQLFIVFFLVTVVVAEVAYFSFRTEEHGPKFIVKLIKDTDIRHARNLLSGATTEKPHIYGKILKFREDYNSAYDYHFNTSTVRFLDYAIKACDSTFSEVNKNLGDACRIYFLPKCGFCPWTSEIIAEEKIHLQPYNMQENFRAKERYWTNEQNCL